MNEATQAAFWILGYAAAKLRSGSKQTRIRWCQDIAKRLVYHHDHVPDHDRDNMIIAAKQCGFRPATRPSLYPGPARQPERT